MTIGLAHYLLVVVRQCSPRMARCLDGTPMVLLSDGRWHTEVMRGMLIDAKDVMTAARDKGISSLDSVAYAVLERNGEITIITKSEASNGD